MKTCKFTFRKAEITAYLYEAERPNTSLGQIDIDCKEPNQYSMYEWNGFIAIAETIFRLEDNEGFRKEQFERVA